MSTSTAASTGAHSTTPAGAAMGLTEKLAHVRKDHVEEKKDLYESLRQGNIQKGQMDEELQDMSMRLYKTPHYKLDDFNPWAITIECILLALVAWSEYPFNVRGLEWFDFPTKATQAFAIGLGAVVAAIAFFSGNFLKKAVVTQKTMDGFLAGLLTLIGFGILYAICQFRAYYLADMATTDGPTSASLSMSVQMLISGGIFLFGVAVAYFFAKPVKDEATKEAFDSRRKEMRELINEIAGTNKKIEHHGKALETKLKNVEHDHEKHLAETAKKDEKKKKAIDEATIPPTPPQRVTSKQQLGFERLTKDFSQALDAHEKDASGDIEQLEELFGKLELASANYPAGDAEFKKLETRFETIKNSKN